MSGRVLENIQILLAEDSRTYRKHVRTVLEDEGGKIAEAVDGREAIDILEKNVGYDLIISDIMMPEVDGVQLAKYNYDNAHIPFIVITSTGDANKALELIELGVQDYILKPFEPRTFISVARNAVNRAMTISRGAGVKVEYDGNLATHEIPTTMNGLKDAIEWIESRIFSLAPGRELNIFVGHLYEFLLNAYEHGNLGLSEAEKGRLLNEGGYEKYLQEMEKNCPHRIGIQISVVNEEVAVSITDRGKGFNHEKYMNMTSDDILERIAMPNGRGIIMAKSYFDKIRYDKGGTYVQITKKFG